MSKKRKTTTSSGAGRKDSLRDRYGRYLPTHGAFQKTRLPEVSNSLDAWRQGLMSDLGGEDNLSTQQQMLIESILDIKGVLLSIALYIKKHSYVVSRGKLNPILANNFLAYANSLERHLKDLGLEKRIPDQAPTLAEIIKDIDSKKQTKRRTKEVEDD